MIFPYRLGFLDALRIFWSGLFAREELKRCSCGLGYTATAWGSLRLCGYQETADEGGIFWLEMRHCESCRSTIAIEVRQ